MIDRICILLLKRVSQPLNSMSTRFDVIIPYHEKDEEIIPYCIDGLQKNVTGFRRIYVISATKPDIDDSEKVTWVPEESFPFSIKDVGTYIKSTNHREGWYYQQLLKLYAHQVIPGLLPHHLIVDSDTVFVQPVKFFEQEKILFDCSGLYVPSYIEHMRAILPEEFSDTNELGGVTDCMMFREDILRDLFHRVETRHEMPMWKVLLSKVDPELYDKSGMSEYEMYFQFALSQHPGIYEVRKLRKSYGVHLNELRRTDVDIISFHAWFRDWQTGRDLKAPDKSQ